MNTWIQKWIFFWLCFQASNAIASNTMSYLEAIPIPPGSQIVPISGDVLQNGSSMSIVAYESNLSVAEVMRFYRHQWGTDTNSDIPDFIESRVGNWQLISQLKRGLNTVVQLKSDNSIGSSGFLSVSEAAGSINQRSFVQPVYGAKLLSNTQTYDQFTRSTVSVLESGESLANFSKNLLAEMTKNEWTLNSKNVYSGSHIYHLSRPSQRLELVVSEDGNGVAVAVINEVTLAD